MKKCLGKYDGEKLYLLVASYAYNGRIYLAVETEEEELYADITINLENTLLTKEEHIFINNDMSRELRNFLEEKGIIGKKISTIKYNLGKYDMVKANFDLIKEYDPEGFERYEKYLCDDMEL